MLCIEQKFKIKTTLNNLVGEKVNDKKLDLAASSDELRVITSAIKRGGRGFFGGEGGFSNKEYKYLSSKKQPKDIGLYVMIEKY